MLRRSRRLADALKLADHPMHALHTYEADRRAKTAEIVRLNRTGGPERVIDEVEKLAPAGFEYADRVLSHDEREAIVKGYAGKCRQSGLHVETGQPLSPRNPNACAEFDPRGRDTAMQLRHGRIAFFLALWGCAAATTARAQSTQPKSELSAACSSKLAAIRVEFVAARVAPDPNLACAIADPVTLIAATAGRRVILPDRPMVTCELALRLTDFLADALAPLARKYFQRDIAAIATGPGYECRGRNRQAGAKISSHGQGLAIDIARVDLSGSKSVVVARPNGVDEHGFLGELRAAGCRTFNTVLGPGSDAFHSDHIHLDLERRGRNGTGKFCQ